MLKKPAVSVPSLASPLSIEQPLPARRLADPWLWLQLLALALALATLLGFAGRWGWLPDLVSHWRWQYLLLAAPLALTLAAGRRWPAASAALGVVLVNGWVLLPLLAPPAAAAAEPAPDEVLRVVSLNIWGGNGELERVLAFLAEADPDVIVLSEVTQMQAPGLAALAEAYPVVVVAQGARMARVLFSRLPVTAADVLPHPVRPSVWATVLVNGRAVTIIGAHPSSPVLPARAAARNAQYAALAQTVRRAATPVLLVGDLNSAPWSPAFQGFLQQAGLQNGRIGQGLRPTWPAWLGPLGIPIDHALTTSGVRVLRLRTGPDVGSDHLPLIVDVWVE